MVNPYSQSACNPIQQGAQNKVVALKPRVSRDPLLDLFKLAWDPKLNPQVRERLTAIMKAPAAATQVATKQDEKAVAKK